MCEKCLKGKEGEAPPEQGLRLRPPQDKCSVCGLAATRRLKLVKCRATKGYQTCGNWVHDCSGLQADSMIRCSVGTDTIECLHCQSFFQGTNQLPVAS